MERKTIFSIALLSLTVSLWGQNKAVINGYVKDGSNGEDLIGATIVIKELGSGSISNVYGFYSVTVPSGIYTIEYSYVGYFPVTRTVEASGDQTINIELTASDTQLQEVVVTAEAQDANVTEVQMSVAKLDMKTISKMPALLGEVDIVKSVQLLPGVSTVGEGASGFNVRGGSVGQNLVLLDEAPVYNSSHLFGFFSVFNPDAVKDVQLFKGGVPSKYGGRISSILDVRMKEGNAKEFEANGGVGLIFSRLAVEAPIVEDKASFILAGRRSYIDVLAAPVLDDASLFFYDLTGKVNYNINDKNRIYLSGYLGRDVFNFDDDQGFSWGNQTATLRWNRLINNRIFFNLTALYSNYDYELAFEQNSDNLFEWESHIETYNLKPEFTYFVNPKNELSFGGDLIMYRFRPAEASAVSEGSGTDISLDDKRGVEASVYIGNKQTITSKLSTEYGLRLSSFRYLGATTVYEYEEVTPGIRPEVISETEVGDGEVIEEFYTLEPRLSFRYQLNLFSSVKASYNRMAQYIHLVSNTTASIPLDVWTPSTNNIDPQIGDQFALGYFRNFGQRQDYEFSVEGYFRNTQNELDYIDGADLLLNEFIEGEVLSGEGRAYGVEFYLKKNTGRFNGWLSYTLGRSELQIEGINNGDWYPNRFDQTHNFKLVGFYDYSERISFSANFTFTTGTPTTFPTSRYEVQGYTVPHNDYQARNDVRIPNYHRLDLSMTLQGKKFNKNGKERKNRDYWTFGLYNLYARENPFSIYFAETDVQPTLGQGPDTQAYQFSVLGSIVPSISYNFKF